MKLITRYLNLHESFCSVQLERYWNELVQNEQNVGVGDTPWSVLTTRAPAVLNMFFINYWICLGWRPEKTPGSSSDFMHRAR